MFKPFFYALGFLTRLPVPRVEQLPSDQEQGQSVLYYPAVGLLIGFLMVLLESLLSTVEPLLVAALLLLFWVAITGALHIDGLADLADAWVGGQGSRERTLSIMKDPASGPIAVATIVLLLMLKFSALVVILSNDSPWTILLLVPMFGRAALIGCFLSMPYIRPDGLGGILAENLPRVGATKLLLALSVFCFVPWGWSAIWVLGVCGAVFVIVRSAVLDRIGGVTGDVAGAMCELTEVTALIACALVI